MNERTSSGRAGLRRVRIGAVVAIAVAIAFVVWLLVRRNDYFSTKTGTTPSNTSTTGGRSRGPVAASRAGLRSLSVSLGHRIYWAGPQANHTYELTRTSSGRIFIRYLPRGVPVGTREPFTIVGTYPVPHALNVLKNLAKKSGEKQLPVPGRGFALYSSSQPTNVYVAYPGSNLQIEVFDPSALRARRLVTSGRVVPVR